MRGRAGFTLVEVLVTMALGAVIIGVLGALTTSGRRNAATVEQRADTAAALRLAAELLQEEVRLAGAVPWPTPGADLEVADLAAWLTPALTITELSVGHAVAMRGVDHRLAEGAVAREVAFDVGTDARGEAQLYRRPAGSTRQPLVSDIEELVVEWVITASGERMEPAAADGLNLAALGVEVASAGERLQFVLELPARPVARVRGRP